MTPPALHTYLDSLMSAGGTMTLANILLIDLVMSGDNAIMIGMAVRALQGRTRRWAIMAGVALATILRITLACFTTLLMNITGLQLAGGLLLLYVVWKFYRELRRKEDVAFHHEGHAKASLPAAIWTIILADFSMSLDNVLAVAGASHGNLLALGIGLVVSILLMAVASNLVAKYLDRFPLLQWAGLLAILFVAADMMLCGSLDVSQRLGGVNVLPSIVVVSAAIFCVLHARTITPANEEKLKQWLSHNYLPVLLVAAVGFLLLMLFGHRLHAWFLAHKPALFVLLTLWLGAVLELFALHRGSLKRKARSARGAPRVD
jgi:YjbE family integral membrane protein